jgi:single-stranded-DNA-specific exonuclease
MTNQWKISSEIDRDWLDQLSDKLGVSTFYTNLLRIRGIETPEDAQAFFNPNLDNLHDPYLMKGMDLAVARIDQALQKDEKVWVYGDYDVDGTTSIATVFGFLRQFIADIEYYVPDREKEGYGVSNQAIDLAIEKKVNLIITLDCGIRSVDLVDKAKQHGIDFIICDHHEVGGELPNAVAVLDAKQPDCNYPFKELSACGVGFKLVQALCSKWDMPTTIALDYIDLVAVSIASDLVPMVGENRILAYHGLKKLGKNPSKGLATIMNKFMTSDSIDVTQVVFMIGPRINAAGRMANARAAVQLLLADTSLDADALSNQLNEYNALRRSLDKDITKQALQQIEDNPRYRNSKTTVVYHPDWHKGVIGIVASRILEEHYKPTIVFTKSGDKLVGSARSIEDFNIHDALELCSDQLIQFGGHKYAAGMTLNPENLEGFMEAFEATARDLTSEQLTRTFYFESEIGLESITPSLWQNLKRFAPFGPENPKPLFVCRNVWDSGNLRTMGSDHTHLKLNLVSEKRNQAIGATAFGFGDFFSQLRGHRKFDVLFTLEENTFRGNSSLELMVKDIKLR